MRDFTQLVLDAASNAGATYADVRVVRTRRRHVGTEDHRVARLVEQEDAGFGVRVIVDGAWGFAASCRQTRAEARRVARLAVRVGRASASVRSADPVELVPEPAQEQTYRSTWEEDPLAVDVGEQTGLLLAANAAGLTVPGVTKCFSRMGFVHKATTFASTEGSFLESEVVHSQARFEAVATDPGDAKTRSYEAHPYAAGYEHIRRADLPAHARRVAAEAVEKLHAKPCPAGHKDLVLDPWHLALTIHESVGHASELDRALGMEESLAGRSFATPDRLGTLRYGSDIVNLEANCTLEHGLASTGFDDDGVACQRWMIVENGMFRGYSTSREVASRIGQERSRGSCRAQGWDAIPIVRIPNLSLLPGRRPCTPDELIAGVDDGIYIEGMGSWSIDQMRVNFQFGGDAFWEIRGGKKRAMLRDVTYQAKTTEFWGSCDGLADQRFWVPWGVSNCGKGDPCQVASMTHGSVPARFRQVSVGGVRGPSHPG